MARQANLWTRGFCSLALLVGLSLVSVSSGSDPNEWPQYTKSSTKYSSCNLSTSACFGDGTCTENLSGSNDWSVCPDWPVPRDWGAYKRLYTRPYGWCKGVDGLEIPYCWYESPGYACAQVGVFGDADCVLEQCYWYVIALNNACFATTGK
jgi:hypothetical protein